MPTTHGGSAAISSSSLARGTLGLHQFGLARLVDTVHRKHALGEIDSNVQNGHDFPFRVS
jgi:hypothetical protein